ncbi:hypothetical protein [Arthrobacter sp. SAFR-044]|uniref:hypothetical protein n=1 Tax=Arthrobacter sp. SAFR-044 TaxID=3387278 RepID=UPI003F7C19B8
MSNEDDQQARLRGSGGHHSLFNTRIQPVNATVSFSLTSPTAGIGQQFKQPTHPVGHEIQMLQSVTLRADDQG